MTELRKLVRIANTDIDGTRPLLFGLQRIFGVKHSFANAVCVVTKIDQHTKIGALSEEQVKQIEATIKGSEKIPTWMLNRQKDAGTGEDKHTVSSDLKLQKEFDIRRLKKIKSYRGMRHQAGLPVRGQRTRGNFRSGKAVGVQKKKIKQQKSAKKPASGSGGKKKK